MSARNHALMNGKRFLDLCRNEHALSAEQVGFFVTILAGQALETPLEDDAAVLADTMNCDAATARRVADSLVVAGLCERSGNKLTSPYFSELIRLPGEGEAA